MNDRAGGLHILHPGDRGTDVMYCSLSPPAVLPTWRASAIGPAQHIVKFAEFRVSVATVFHKEREKRTHSFNIRAVHDGSALARPAHETGTRQNPEMRRQSVLGAVPIGNQIRTY